MGRKNYHPPRRVWVGYKCFKSLGSAVIYLCKATDLKVSLWTVQQALQKGGDIGGYKISETPPEPAPVAKALQEKRPLRWYGDEKKRAPLIKGTWM